MDYLHNYMNFVPLNNRVIVPNISYFFAAQTLKLSDHCNLTIGITLTSNLKPPHSPLYLESTHANLGMFGQKLMKLTQVTTRYCCLDITRLVQLYSGHIHSNGTTIHCDTHVTTRMCL